ncbi:hypothetical protein EBR21_09750, partial [bacterium]|nr:hypothetical protein [bacterium]
MKSHRSSHGIFNSLFEQRRLKPTTRSRVPVTHGTATPVWGYIFLPNLDSESLFAARTLAQALSEHVLRPHLTLLLVSLQHTLRYFGSWDTLARVYHAQVQHLAPAARPRLLLTHHLFAGLHFGATHSELEFAIANENNLLFRQHLGQRSLHRMQLEEGRPAVLEDLREDVGGPEAGDVAGTEHHGHPAAARALLRLAPPGAQERVGAAGIVATHGGAEPGEDRLVVEGSRRAAGRQHVEAHQRRSPLPGPFGV